MKRMKKCLSLILVLCMSTFGLPAFAVMAPDAVKTTLSDEALAEAVGGNYDARILTGWHEPNGKPVPVAALFVPSGTPNGNGSWQLTSCTGQYTFEVLNGNGAVVQTLATGTVAGNAVQIVNGTVTAANNVNTYTLRARAYCPEIPFVESVATSRRVN